MPFRARPSFGRPQILASALAALFVLAGTGTVAAETSVTLKPPPEPRVQRPDDVAGYRLPFEPGLAVYIHQGWNSIYSHNGRSAYAYDFGLQLGTPVLAAASGVVSYVHSGERGCGGADLRNHANYVTIDHPDGSSTQYGHLSTVEVEVGDVVQVGQQIATSGMTGYTGCQPHLHFARQLQGSGVTQSVPVYFEEFASRQLVEGESIQTSPACLAKPSKGGKAAKADAKASTKGAVEPGATLDPKALAKLLKAAANPTGWFCATYRGGTDAEAPILFSRSEPAIDDNWAKHGPGGYWLDNPADGFSASWTGRFKIDQEGVYALDVRASGRVRVTIDGVVLVDMWRDLARPRDTAVAWRATEGLHLIQVEHVDADGHGLLRVAWSPQLLDGAWVRWAEAKPEA